MKKILTISVLLLVSALIMPSMAQNKKKLGWKDGKMPELTKVKEINDYLLTCDTIINNLMVVEEGLTWYKVVPVEVKNEEDGSVSMTYHIKDENGNFRGKNEALKQTLDVIAVCVLLPLRAANIGLQTPLYTTSLPQLGLSAIKYAKYSKLGPQLAARCTGDVVETLKKLRKQGKAIRALKKMTNESGELTDPNININEVEGLGEFVESEPIQVTDTELAELLAKEQEGDSNVGDIDEGALDLED